MFKKKSLILICMCFALLMSACGITDILPSKSESIPAAAPVHSDWKAYYAEILNGTLPEALAADLQQRRLPATRDSFRSYFVCDWDNDGTPELFLRSIQTRYVFIVRNDESYICADMLGINFREHSLILKGQPGLNSDPGINEFDVLLPDADDSIYFNLDTDGNYTVIDPVSGKNAENSADTESAALYNSLFERYIPGTAILISFAEYALSDTEGLDDVQTQDTEFISKRAEAFAAFDEYCSGEMYFQTWLEFMNDTAVRKTFFDFEYDGIPELIITNGSEDPAKRVSYVFEYTDEGVIRYVGIGPVNAFYSECIHGMLLGYAGNIWTHYIKNGNKYNPKQLDEGNPYLPVESDGMNVVKGFEISPLPFDICIGNNMLAVSFYR